MIISVTMRIKMAGTICILLIKMTATVIKITAKSDNVKD